MLCLTSSLSLSFSLSLFFLLVKGYLHEEARSHANPKSVRVTSSCVSPRELLAEDSRCQGSIGNARITFASPSEITSGEMSLIVPRIPSTAVGTALCEIELGHLNNFFLKLRNGCDGLFQNLGHWRRDNLCTLRDALLERVLGRDMPHDRRRLHNSAYELCRRDFHCLQHSLNPRDLSLHHHRHFDNVVDVLNLRDLRMLCHLVDLVDRRSVRVFALRCALGARHEALAHRRSVRENAPR